MTDRDRPARLDFAPVADERDQETWEDTLGLYEQPDVVDLWRTAGFTLAVAERWDSVARQVMAGDELADEDDVGSKVALVSALIVAGVSPEEAVDWSAVLPWRRCGELAKMVVEWRTAGFTPASARTWAEDEPLESAVLLANAGWRPAERDLLTAWVQVRCGHLDLDYRTRMLNTAAAPAHVLDYVRAGIAPEEVTYYERLRRDGHDVAEDLQAREAASAQPDQAMAEAITTLETELWSQHPSRGARPGAGSLRQPRGMQHKPESSLSADFVAPEFVEFWGDSGVGVWRRSYGDWEGHWPPEDSALEPRLAWSDEHREVLQQAYTRRWSEHLEPGAEYQVTWPPRASLWSEGSAHEGEPGECSIHGADYDESCTECEDPTFGPDIVEPAEWHWYVTVETYEPCGEDSMCLEDTDNWHFMTTGMDPRDVEYQE